MLLTSLCLVSPCSHRPSVQPSFYRLDRACRPMQLIPYIAVHDARAVCGVTDKARTQTSAHLQQYCMSCLSCRVAKAPSVQGIEGIVVSILTAGAGCCSWHRPSRPRWRCACSMTLYTRCQKTWLWDWKTFFQRAMQHRVRSRSGLRHAPFPAVTPISCG